MPKPTVERSTAQAEEMRQQRNQEVRQLIGSTVNNAKAIFAQNTAAGQLTSKMAKTAPAKPVRNSITRSVNNQQQQSQQQQSPEPDNIQEQQQQQPLQPENSELPESTADAAPLTNNKLQNESLTSNDQHLDEDDSDPYSTIKRSPYSKVTQPSNSQNEANGNGQQIIEHSAHDSQPIGGTGNNHLMLIFSSAIR